MLLSFLADVDEGPPPALLFSKNKQNQKRQTSQPDALLDEGFYGRAAPVGSMGFFNFDTGRGGEGQLKKSSCILAWVATQGFSKIAHISTFGCSV